jgi:hypothetical protein
VFSTARRPVPFPSPLIPYLTRRPSDSAGFPGAWMRTRTTVRLLLRRCESRRAEVATRESRNRARTGVISTRRARCPPSPHAGVSLTSTFRLALHWLALMFLSLPLLSCPLAFRTSPRRLSKGTRTLCLSRRVFAAGVIRRRADRRTASIGNTLAERSCCDGTKSKRAAARSSDRARFRSWRSSSSSRSFARLLLLGWALELTGSTGPVGVGVRRPTGRSCYRSVRIGKRKEDGGVNLPPKLHTMLQV